MSAVLLANKPLSGTYPECSWASGSGPNVWVQFDVSTPWVGVFAAGESVFSAVRAFGDKDSRVVLVIAGGWQKQNPDYADDFLAELVDVAERMSAGQLADPGHVLLQQDDDEPGVPPPQGPPEEPGEDRGPVHRSPSDDAEPSQTACCCIVKSISIPEVKNATTGEVAGDFFEAKIEYEWVGSASYEPCKLEWFERSSQAYTVKYWGKTREGEEKLLPYEVSPDGWNDLNEEGSRTSYAPSLQEYHRKMAEGKEGECPKGTQTAVIPDAPRDSIVAFDIMDLRRQRSMYGVIRVTSGDCATSEAVDGEGPTERRTITRKWFQYLDTRSERTFERPFRKAVKEGGSVFHGTDTSPVPEEAKPEIGYDPEMYKKPAGPLGE